MGNLIYPRKKEAPAKAASSVGQAGAGGRAGCSSGVLTGAAPSCRPRPRGTQQRREEDSLHSRSGRCRLRSPRPTLLGGPQASAPGTPHEVPFHSGRQQL